MNRKKQVLFLQILISFTGLYRHLTWFAYLPFRCPTEVPKIIVITIIGMTESTTDKSIVPGIANNEAINSPFCQSFIGKDTWAITKLVVTQKVNWIGLNMMTRIKQILAQLSILYEIVPLLV